MVEIYGKQDQDNAQNGGTPEKNDRQTPLLDLSEAAVKELVRAAKKCGYVEYDQINALLASSIIDLPRSKTWSGRLPSSGPFYALPDPI
jgi:hypothetical protein